MADFKEVYYQLLDAFGPQGWWPIDGKYIAGGYSKPASESQMLEICIGAILTQNTNWSNVEKALEGLKNARLFTLKHLSAVSEKKLSALIRSSGYFRQKAKKLKLFAAHLLKYDSLTSFFNHPTKVVREELLSIWGIGPETADSMLLYAGKHPIFVIDAYTKRIMSRIGVCEQDVDYHALQGEFHKYLDADVEKFNEFHALLVELAKRNCTKSNPSCSTCPLNQSCERIGV